MTERFVRDQNIIRFEGLLEGETDGDKRELLHALLIQEGDRIGSSFERLERLGAFIERLAILIARQKRVIADLVAKGRDERRARLLLVHLNRTHTLFRHRRQALGRSVMASFDPTSAKTEHVALFSRQSGADGGTRAPAAKAQRVSSPLQLRVPPRSQELGLS